MTTNSFTHAGVDTEAHTYHVTAVYNRGESEVSNAVVLSPTSGVDAFAAPGISVAVEGHDIVVTAADTDAVRIVATDGRTVYAGLGNSRVSVATGIYLVKVGQTVTKAVVR